MKYVQSDLNGVITAYYDDGVNSAAQIGNALQITESQWLDCINNPGKWMVKSGKLSLAPAPTATQLLAQAQSSKIGDLYVAYLNNIVQPVSIKTSTGITKTYQADPVSVQNISRVLSAFTPTGATPKDFYWLSSDNKQVPFMLVDLQNLAQAIATQGWVAFQHLQTLKAFVMSATTVSQVAAVPNK